MSQLHFYLITDPQMVDAMSRYTLSLIQAKREAMQWLECQSLSGKPVYFHEADGHSLAGFELQGDAPEGWKFNATLKGYCPVSKAAKAAVAQLPQAGANPMVSAMVSDDALFRGFRYEACDYFALCRTKAVLQAPFKQLKKVSYLTLLRELRARRSNGYFYRPGGGSQHADH